MAITVFYTQINKLLGSGEYEKLLIGLPPVLQSRIAAYQKPMDRQLRLFGKLLLKNGLQRSGLEADLIKEIFYSGENKPYIKNTHVNFSISHSGSMAVCAINTTGNIGVDIEKIALVDLNLMADHFDKATWNEIIKSNDRLTTFYEHWTKREAALKASGKGLEKIDLKSIAAKGERLKIGEELFYHDTRILNNEYVLSVASCKEIGDVVYQKNDVEEF